MSDDWQIGDLAECIDGDWDDGDPESLSQRPRLGEVLMVIDIDLQRQRLCASCKTVHDKEGLAFAGKPDWYWDSRRFRKVPPRGEDASITRRATVPA